MSEHPEIIEPGMKLHISGKGEIPATAWTLSEGDEVIAAGELADPSYFGSLWWLLTCSGEGGSV